VRASECVIVGNLLKKGLAIEGVLFGIFGTPPAYPGERRQ
jgi:hypothetical protein